MVNPVVNLNSKNKDVEKKRGMIMGRIIKKDRKGKIQGQI